MYEFTKDELQIILLDLIFYAEQKNVRGLRESPTHKELRDKVESMIDNYCDHEWSDAATNQFYCIHCQKHIDKIASGYYE